MSTSTIHLKASELHQLLAPVVPLAGRDDLLPILKAVSLTVRDGEVLAVATDRYRVGLCRQPLPAEHEGDALTQAGDWSALVALEDVQLVLRLFKANRTDDALLTLTVASGGQTLTVERTHASTMYADVRVVAHLVDGTYPKLGGIFAAILEAPPALRFPVTVNPQFLNDFRHAQRDARQPLILWAQEERTKPIGVACGDHFLGALMQVRSADGEGAWVDGPDREAWRALASSIGTASALATSAGAA